MTATCVPGLIEAELWSCPTAMSRRLSFRDCSMSRRQNVSSADACLKVRCAASRVVGIDRARLGRDHHASAREGSEGRASSCFASREDDGRKSMMMKPGMQQPVGFRPADLSEAEEPEAIDRTRDR
jgi:hypothetical protein